MRSPLDEIESALREFYEGRKLSAITIMNFFNIFTKMMDRSEKEAEARRQLVLAGEPLEEAIIGGFGVLRGKETGKFISKRELPQEKRVSVATPSGGTTTITLPERKTPERLIDFEGKPLKLNASQSSSLEGFNLSLDLLSRAKQLSPEVNTGPIVGRLSPFLRQIDKDDPKRVELDAILRNLQTQFQKAISGVAVSEPEAKRLSKFLPSINDTEGVLQTKMRLLGETVNKQKESLLNNLGAVVPEEDTIRVRNLQTGQTGTIESNEFDPKLYQKL